jgi:hypothetical protein
MMKKIFAGKQLQTSPAEKLHDWAGRAVLCGTSAFVKESIFFLSGVKHRPGE